MNPVHPAHAATIDLHLNQHRWQGLQLRLPGVQAGVSQCEVDNAHLHLRATPHGWSVDRLEAARMTVEGLRLQMSLPAAAALPRRAEANAATLQALHGLNGTVQALVADAAWVLDARITAPVQDGRIDFDQVTVEHLGPDSAMGVSAGGVYIDAPRLARRFLYVFTGALLPGVTPEERQGRSVRRRGALSLPQALQALLQHPQAPGQWANAEAEAAMVRSQVSGELQLGDGVLGLNGLQLSLMASALGANRVSLATPALGEELLLRWPRLVAQQAQWSHRGAQAGSGRIDGAIEVTLQQWWPGRRPTGPAPSVLIQGSLTLRDVRWHAPPR